MEKRLIALPPYVDPEAWDGFESMRKTIKKPLTDRARKLVLYELQRIKDAGHCPNAALDQSTNHCWCDVFVPNDKPIEAAPGARVAQTEAWLSEHERAKREATPPPDSLLKLVGKKR
jgi:hypothetical protein